MVDIAKIFGESCIDSSTCLRPNAKPYFASTGQILGTIGRLNLQNIYQEDFPAVDMMLKEKGRRGREKSPKSVGGLTKPLAAFG